MIKKEEIKLLKLMKAYYKKDILFDEEFVYKVVEIIEKSRKLDGFIDDVILLEDSTNKVLKDMSFELKSNSVKMMHFLKLVFITLIL